MTLHESLTLMQQAGFTQVLDKYSHSPRPIQDWIDESRLDLNDYIPDVPTGQIVQNHPHPSNFFRCS